jgi:hypothetical protein
MIKVLIAKLTARRNARKFAQAVKLVESQGLTICEIATKAGTDYIRAADGSWHRIGRKA